MSDVEFKAHIPTIQYGFLEITSGNAYEIRKALDDPEFREIFAQLSGKKEVPTPVAEGVGDGPAADASESVVTADPVAEAAAEEAALTPLEKARQRMKKGA